MRVVMDTNLWLSGLVYSAASSPPRQIIEQLERGNFVVIMSVDLFEEFDEVMQRHGLDQATRHKWLQVLTHTHLKIPPYVDFVESTLRVQAITEDPDDNHVLECAVAGQADVIVSGDKHLRALKVYQGIPILSPREFLARLTKDK